MGKYRDLLEDIKYFYEKSSQCKENGNTDEAERYKKIVIKLKEELMKLKQGR